MCKLGQLIKYNADFIGTNRETARQPDMAIPSVPGSVLYLFCIGIAHRGYCSELGNCNMIDFVKYLLMKLEL